MGHKARIKGAGYDQTIIDEPKTVELATDKELFNELTKRGYLIEVPGGKIQMIGKGAVGVDAEIVPMQEFNMLAPAASFMFKNKNL